MSKEDKISMTLHLINEALKKLNSNYKSMLEVNSCITPRVVVLLSLYQRFNDWSDSNKSIRNELLEEVYNIQVKSDPFLTEELTNEYLIQLLQDIEGKYQRIPTDINIFFRFDSDREFNTIEEYINKYILFNETDNKFYINDDINEQITNYYKER